MTGLTRREMLIAGAGAALGVSAGEARAQRVEHVADICVFGATVAGVMAAVQARKMGHTAIVVEPSSHVGGMTTGGLGWTDIGNKAAIGGLARTFYERVHAYYVQTYGPASVQVRDCANGYRFEPSVASRVLRSFIEDAAVTVHTGKRLRSVHKEKNRLVSFMTEDGDTFCARVFIDATYEGDLMARTRVSYIFGREPNAMYGETVNGIFYGPLNQFYRPVDPYRVPGDPRSGLLKTIDPYPFGEQGEGDKRIQAYNFRMCMTKDPKNRIPFPKPRNYDPDTYLLLARYIDTGIFDALQSALPIPNGKTDTNNEGGFSTDFIGGNYRYPDGGYRTRHAIVEDHKTYQQGLMWFLCHDRRVPERIREQVSEWGLAADEFQETDGWPPQIYVREARRMVSSYVMTEHNCRGQRVAEDPVSLGAYGMDSHNCRRMVRDGVVINEGDMQVGGFPPYPVSYRAIVPKEAECANLIVPVCLSATHASYGSIRMEPVFMILGQSAGTAAAMAVEAARPVQQIDYSKLHDRLIADGQVLHWPPQQPDKA